MDDVCGMRLRATRRFAMIAAQTIKSGNAKVHP